MAKLTKNEMLLLDNIAQNEYLGGRCGPNQFVWCNCLDYSPNQISTRSIPGIMASLVKKELVKTDGEVCCLTEEGFKTWQTITL